MLSLLLPAEAFVVTDTAADALFVPDRIGLAITGKLRFAFDDTTSVHPNAGIDSCPVPSGVARLRPVGMPGGWRCLSVNRIGISDDGLQTSNTMVESMIPAEQPKANAERPVLPWFFVSLKSKKKPQEALPDRSALS